MSSSRVDFGPSAEDYALHRPGFPSSFFDRARALGVGLAGQRVLDLGTGTGTLALGFASDGCEATGLDPSSEMLARAAALGLRVAERVQWVLGHAETTGLESGAFDVVCAGQCWHWFDAPRAAAEARRVLAPGGRIVVAHFSYLPEASALAEATEALVLRHHPTWAMAGSDGRAPRVASELTTAGFDDASTFEYLEPVAFTRESWRGRFRARNGVLALPPAARDAFDRDLAALLETDPRFKGDIVVPHRIYAVVARKPL